VVSCYHRTAGQSVHHRDLVGILGQVGWDQRNAGLALWLLDEHHGREWLLDTIAARRDRFYHPLIEDFHILGGFWDPLGLL